MIFLDVNRSAAHRHGRLLLHNAEVYDRSIDVQILRLRRKIEPDPAHPQFIKTERGAGYLFDAAVDAVH